MGLSSISIYANIFYLCYDWTGALWKAEHLFSVGLDVFLFFPVNSGFSKWNGKCQLFRPPLSEKKEKNN